MSDKGYIFQFLGDLRNNNSKEWMVENKTKFEKAKRIWVEEIEKIQNRLSKYNPIYNEVPARSTISRINNNRMFHPEKPIYKDFFSCEPGKKNPMADLFYISISPGGSFPAGSFMGGGLYQLDKDMLTKVREAIDYNGDVLQGIISEKKFVDFYGGLNDDPNKLKTAPRNYDKEHEYIELLKYRSFTATRDLTEKEVCSTGFVDLVEEAFVTIKPFSDYLKQSLTFEN
ncbi:DUF2461 domain-containing protein [Fulvivirga sp. M361]|uniref:DUF2461 domain-containing protein n=1 Tax=Fulvivirga sp. M361 TaxID=2594266 RepID=UPI001625C32C|nr:DUF2461 domain-containing protein [Fulvivirga sp. M361]